MVLRLRQVGGYQLGCGFRVLPTSLQLQNFFVFLSLYMCFSCVLGAVVYAVFFS